MENNWIIYRNGNYRVYLNKSNGTKIKETAEDEFRAEFPESFDMKICNRCDMMCKQCHENSTPDGCCGDLLGAEFINTLHPHTEIAIGGGNPLEHPDLEEFLWKCKDLELIPSMTVHQHHFMKNIEFIDYLVTNKLIYGIGVSIVNPTDELIETLKEYPNAVCHIIAGIATEDVINKLAHNNLKVLILGYKIFRRGEKLYEEHSSEIDFLIQYMTDILPNMMFDGWFNTVSFDNLALKQLNVEKLMTPEEWKSFYMGDDGSHTCYIDLVNKEFARSSTSTKRYPLSADIKDMFKIILEEKI